jgi:hypothetical protein
LLRLLLRWLGLLLLLLIDSCSSRSGLGNLLLLLHLLHSACGLRKSLFLPCMSLLLLLLFLLLLHLLLVFLVIVLLASLLLLLLLLQLLAYMFWKQL